MNSWDYSDIVRMVTDLYLTGETVTPDETVVTLVSPTG